MQQENARQNLARSDQRNDEYREGTEYAVDKKFIKLYGMVAITQIDLGIFYDREYVKNPGKNKNNPPCPFSDFWPLVTSEDQQKCQCMGDDIRKPVVCHIHCFPPFLVYSALSQLPFGVSIYPHTVLLKHDHSMELSLAFQ